MTRSSNISSIPNYTLRGLTACFPAFWVRRWPYGKYSLWNAAAFQKTVLSSLWTFWCGLQTDVFIYISLDIFCGMKHNKLTELEAWLYFLGSDNPADILRIVRSHPIFQELYRDIVNFRFQPKELISMYSDALLIMDQNMV